MNLDQTAIEEFKQIYKKEFGKEISDDQANEWGTELIELMKILLSKPAGSKLTIK